MELAPTMELAATLEFCLYINKRPPSNRSVHPESSRWERITVHRLQLASKDCNYRP